jgi:hypothetical protein
MALYFLVALQNSAPAFQTALSSKIEAANFYTIEDGKWIVESAATTSKDFSESLGSVAKESTFVVVPVTGYFGRAQPDLWEWLAAKLTAKSLAAV